MGIKGVDQFINDTLIATDGKFIELNPGDKLWYSRELQKVYFTWQSPWRQFIIIKSKSPWPHGKDECYFVDLCYKHDNTGEEKISIPGIKMSIRSMNAVYVLNEV